MYRVCLSLLVCLLFSFPTVSTALPGGSEDTWSEIQKVLASDGATGDYFGNSVSVDGDVAVVGASADESNTGSAYVLRRGSDGTWSQEAKLTASDGATGDYFGVSVSVDGDVAVVGALYDEFIGSAYVFRYSGGSWSQEAKLTASDGATNDFFGCSVSVNGDVVVIGAERKSVGRSTFVGAAYVFRYSSGSWSEEQKLTGSDASSYSYFGRKVSVSGDVAMIGTNYKEAVYVFRYSSGSWSQEQKLTSVAPGDSFGNFVSVDGDVAVIGAPNDDDGGENSGSAYVFRYSSGSWSQEQKLTASDAAASDNFGFAVSLSGDVVAVGAYGNDDAGTSSGSAYVFRYADGNWSEEQKVTDSGGAADDQFGYSVSVSGDVVVAGAYGDESSTGSAVIYESSGSTPSYSITVSTSPAGFAFTVDGTEYTTAQTFSWEEGSSHTIETATPQDNVVGNEFAFDAWTDGGAASHQVTVTSDSSFTASFTHTADLSTLEWQEAAKLLASDGAANDYFGNSVSVDGDVCVVGAYSDDDNGSGSGSAYVLRRSSDGTWFQEAKLLALDGAANDRFGWSVSASGDIAVVGAYENDDAGSASGSAYVFHRASDGTWSQEQKLTASDAAAGDRFGQSVSVSGDMCVIGAWADADNGSYSGSAYVFRRASDGTWSQEQKLTASDAVAEDRFGWSVSASGDVCVVGAYRDDDNGSNSGSAYVFRRGSGGTWSEEQKLTASDGAANDEFGKSVSVSGDVCVVGAGEDGDTASGSGSAYTFHQGSDGTWSQEQKLTASDAVAEDRFGWSVSVSGDVCIVGANGANDGDSWPVGAAYVYRRASDGTWPQEQKLTASDGESGDGFGSSVSVSGDICIAGAYYGDNSGTRTGSARAFELLSPPPVSVTVSTSPAGFAFTVDGTEYTTAQTFSWEDSSSHTIAATSPQTTSGGDEYTFDAWNDGGAISRQVTVTSDSSFVASFDAMADLSTFEWGEAAKVLASDAAWDDYYGRSVSIDGDACVVGAPGNDDNGSFSGSAYVLRRASDGTWSQEAILLPGDGMASASFGHSVSISGDNCIVGAYKDATNGSNSGVAYAFHRASDGTWSQEAKLIASDAEAGDYFGRSVAVNGDFCIVGANEEATGGSYAGAAYVFRRASDGTWSQEQKLAPTDLAAGDYFGYTVAIDGSRCAVSSWGETDNGYAAGAAYVFLRGTDGTWLQETKLLASDGAMYDRFGGSISLNGHNCVVGAYAHDHDTDGDKTGAVYAFRRASDNTWSQEAELLPSDTPTAGDWFGVSVSVSGDRCLVGTRCDDDNADNSGSAYVFSRASDGTWTQDTKILADDAETSDEFGYTVSLSGDRCIVGTPESDDNGSSSGSAYLFELVPPPVSVTVGASPEGFAFTVDGTEYTTAQTFSWENGSSHTIEAATPQDNVVGNEFAFDAWTDGGAASHQVTVTSDSSFVASFDRAIDPSTLSWQEAAALLASDGAASDFFGNSVSVSGDVAVIGAYGDDDAGSGSGSVYVFHRGSDGTWSLEQKLTASDGALGDSFGYSVSVHGDVCVVGARQDDDNGSSSGSAYIFRRASDGTWSEEAKLTASDGAADDRFGWSVSVSGDVCVVAASWDESYTGSAYVFRRASDGTWSEEQKLTASDGAMVDYFGWSVSVSGDICVVGALMDDDNGDGSGSAYVFHRGSDGTWSQEQKLTAPDGAAEDRFGTSVSVSRDICVIGAYYDDDDGEDSGSAYVFLRASDGTWSQEQKLTASDGAAGDNFGTSVSVSGDVCIVGASWDDDIASSSGSAYTFRRASDGTWSQEAKLTASNGAASDNFGTSVSVSGDVCFAGAINNDDTDSNAGSANVFELRTPPAVVTVGTSPAGFAFTVDGTEYTSAQTFSWENGSSHTIATTTPQDNVVGNEFAFDAWSDAGAASHQVTVTSDSSFTASFTHTADLSTLSWQEAAKLLASDGAADDAFGTSVSVDGDVCVVGAPYDDNNGSAYVLRRSSDGTWSQEARLLALDGAANDEFGSSVSVSGDIAVVGAYYNDDAGSASGSAYVFHRASDGTWSQEQKLTASDAAAGDNFGKSVSVSGDMCVIGAWADADNGSYSGSAYVFRRASGGTWSQEQKLTASDGEGADRFGWSVSASGDVCVVGAYMSNSNKGSAYVFRSDSDGTWSQEQKLTASDGEGADRFGWSVSVSGDVCVVGAENGGNMYGSGSAYTFHRGSDGTWSQEAKLLPADAAMEDRFGGSVSVSGDVCIVGANGANDGDSWSVGAAYVYRRASDGTWPQEQKLTASDGVMGASFGKSVSVSGDICIAGAERDDNSGTITGSARAFELLPPPPVSVTVGTSPEGFSFTVDGTEYTTAQTFSWENGSSHTIAAATPQDNVVGNEFAFDAWSDAGAASHQVTVTSDSSFTASFTHTADLSTLSWQEAAALLASDGAASDYFGSSVSASGDVCVVGALWDDDAGTSSGSAYVLRRSSDGTWSQEAKLLASDGAESDRFGESVSVSGDIAVVGAYENDDAGSASGSAYVFHRASDGTWSQEQKLTASDAAAGDYFGRSVSVSGDVCVVGAYFDDSGSAYVFRRGSGGTWSEEQKLTASDGAESDYFGRSVSVSGDVCVIGADHDDNSGTRTGSAYVFRRGSDETWSEEQKLTASDGAANDEFGKSVSVSGDVCVVGAGEDGDMSGSGSAYTFHRGSDGTWSQEAKLLPADAAMEDHFGWSVSVSGDVCIVGSSGDNDDASGSAYVYRRASDGTWPQEAKLTASDGVAGASFGSSVSVSGDICIAGAYYDDNSGTRTGSARAFELLPPLPVTVTVNTNPEGFAFTVDGTEYTTAQTFSWESGSNHTIDVTSPQTSLSGNEYAFDAWSDAGAASHQVTVTSDSSFIASFDMTTDFSTLEWQEVSRVFDADGATMDNYGYPVSVSGDGCAVGAPGDDDNGDGSGSVFVLRRGSDGTWSQEAKLHPADPAVDDQFGGSLSLSGDVCIIGVARDDDNGENSGSAYVFRRASDGTWGQEAKLTASDAAEGDNFGGSVAISGDMCVVGATGDEDNGEGSGSAYVFRRGSDGTWSEEAKLTASDGAAEDRFGTSATLSGITCVIGASLDDDNVTDSGSAYVFRRNSNGTWTQEAKLTVSDAEEQDQFGEKSSLSGDVYISGLVNRDDFGTNSGAAYIFRRASDGTWSQEQKLLASDGGAQNQFGCSVSVSGDICLVGAYADDDLGPYSGSAYVFRRGSGGTWTQEQKLLPEGGDGMETYGSAVSISGDACMVGAIYNDGNAVNSGVVHAVALAPKRFDVAVSTSPEGFAFTVDGTEYDTPQTFDWEIGSTHTIEAATPQDNVVGNEFAFDAWSDAGAASHQVTVTSDSSFTASFARTADPANLEWQEISKVFASDSATNDMFGVSVSVDGDVAVVGAQFDDDAGSSSGSAYVLRRGSDGSWSQEAKLTASDASEFDYFGRAVSVNGDVAMVGAHGDDDAGSSSGSAYVFRYADGSWSQEAKLVSSDAASDDYFGISVSVSGNVAVVGANGDESSAGAAYVFRYADGSWSQDTKLTASDAAASDKFGFSVSVDGDVVVAGANGDESSAGAAYVFRYADGSWSQDTKLTASDAAASDQFGFSVSVDGDVVVAGANGDESSAGAAYVFRYADGSWSQDTKLTASDAAASDNFGCSVSVGGDAVVAGARSDESGAGSAYVFRYADGSWSQDTKLTASDAAASDNFGCSVSLSGDVVMAGANLDESFTGSVVLYEASVPEDQAPVWAARADTSVAEGEALTFTVSATDADDDELVYASVELPTGAAFNTETQVFSWTPTYEQAGVDTAIFSVTANSVTVRDSVIITVTNTDQAPVWAARVDTSVAEMEALSFTVSATDADDDELVYASVELPTGAAFNTETQVFSWTPTYEQAGVDTAIFSVTANSVTVRDSVIITVTNTDQAPVWAARVDTSVAEMEALSFTVSATDADDDELIYASVELPTGAAFNTETQVFSWTPTYEQAGKDTAIFSVTANSVTVRDSVIITVTNTDRAPVWAARVDTSVAEMEALSFTVSATDADDDELIYASVELPTGAAFNTETGAFSWTPTYEQAGKDTAIFSVTANSVTVRDSVIITVTNTDQAPVWAARVDTSVAEMEALSFTVSATDADDDELIYASVELPTGASFNTETQAFSWTPTYDQAGKDTAIFSVTANSVTVRDSVIITVTNTDRAPVWAARVDTSVAEMEALSFTVSATDADDDELIYASVELPTGAAFNTETGAFSWTPTYEQAGVDTAIFSVTANSVTVRDSVIITVTETDRAPVWAECMDKSVAEMEALAFTVSATDADDDELVYASVELPTGASFNTETRAFSWTPTYEQAGVDTAIFSVTANSVTVRDSVIITVTNTDRAPVWAARVDTSVAEMEALSFTVSATDADDDELIYASVELPTGAAFNTETGAFSWTPTYEQAGVDTAIFSVTANSVTVRDSVIITVTETDRAPVWAECMDKSVAEMEALAFTVSATDADDDELVYASVELPTGASFNTETRAFSWTPTYEQAGVDTAIFSVTANSVTVRDSVIITVTNSDRAPVWAECTDKSVAEMEALSFTVSATDADDDELVYASVELPTGASFNTETGAFSWTPTYEQAGKDTAIFSVTANSVTVRDSVIITVTNADRAPVWAECTDKSVAEMEALSFTVSATDADDDELVYASVELPTGASFNTETGAFSWTPTYEQAGVDTAIFSVTANSVTVRDSVIITVTNSDRAPVWAECTDKSVAEMEALSFTVSATDADDDELVYASVELPTGASFNTETGAFSWTPTYDQAGVDTAIFSVTGNSVTVRDSVIITVTNSDRAPVWAECTDKSVAEMEALAFTVSATDADDDELVYASVELPTGASFNTETQAFSWTPTYDQAGKDTAIFSVTANSVTVRDSVIITVTNADRAPVWAECADKSVAEMDALSFTVSATDADEDELIYASVDIPTGAAFNAETQVFSWTPTYEQAGKDTAIFSVTANSVTVRDSVIITVTNADRAPVWAECTDKSVAEMEALSFTVSATDADDDELVYASVELPTGASFNTETGAFSWTPTYDQAGVDTAIFSVTGNSVTVRDSVIITVTNSDRAPVWAECTDKSVAEMEALAFTVSATDADDDELVYASVELPTGASFNTETQAFSWTPTYDQAGKDTAIFSVTANSVTVRDSVIITVTNTDQAPVWAECMDKSVAEMEALAFTVSATDADDDELVYASVELPTGAAFNTETQVFSWTPTYEQAGIDTAIFSVTGNGVTVRDSVIITVTNADRAPVWAECADKSVAEMEALSFTVSATDADEDELVYASVELPTGAAFNTETGAFSWTPTYEQAGVDTAIFSVTGNGVTVRDSVIITVTNSDRAPVWAECTDKSVAEMEALSFTVSATDADEDELAYASVELPTGASFNTETGAFSWTPTYEQAGVDTAIFSVTANSVTVRDSVIITVTNSDRAPVWAECADKSVAEMEALSFTVSATDADDDELVYASVELPTGAAFNTETQAFSWTPTYEQAGVDTAIFSVTANSVTVRDSVIITVTNSDRAPVWAECTDKSVAEMEALSFTVSATDADDDELVYASVELPTGASFNTETRAFSWTPTYDQAGVDTAIFSVTGNGVTVRDSVIITVTNSDRAPVWAECTDKSVAEMEALSFTVSATDADEDELAYASVELPTGASFNTETQVFSWTPTYEQAGKDTAIFSVTANSVTVRDSVIITVTNSDRAPVWAECTDKSVAEMEALAFTVSATDADEDELAYASVELPAGASFNTETGAFSWTPTYEQAGVDTAIFSVTANSVTVRDSVIITVTNTDQAPVWAECTDKSVAEMEALAFTVSATDADGDELVYASVELPTGASFNTETQAFSWTPTYEQAGVDTAIFSVTGNGVTVRDSVIITVTATDRAPIWAARADTTTGEAEALTFTVSASDADDDELIYASVELPTGASFNTETGAFSWTPTYDQAGIDTAIFSVTANGVTVRDSVIITVTETDRAPIWAARADTTVSEMEALSFTVSASDPDGDELSYVEVSLPAGAAFNTETGAFTWTPTYDQAGIDTAIFAAMANDAAVLDTVSITVENVNRAPVWAVRADTSTVEADTLKFTVSAVDPDGGDVTINTVSLPTGAQLDETTGAFSWTPTYEQAGVESLIVSATDQESVVLDTVSITVLNSNRLPQLVCSALDTATERQSYSFVLNARDADAYDSVLTISAVTCPEWLQIAKLTDTTAVLSGLPAESDTTVGTDITIRIKDSMDSTDVTFSLAVIDTNYAPVVDSLASVLSTGLVGKVYADTLCANDPDGCDQDSLTWEIVDNDGLAGLAIENDSVLVHAAFTADDTSGSFDVVLRVVDMAGVADSVTLNLKVEKPVSVFDDLRPTETALGVNFPNPFNPTTTIPYSLMEDVTVRLVLYNTLGQQVRVLVNERMAAGYHRIQWDGRDAMGRSCASGLYFIRMVAGDYVSTRRMMMVK